jgi:mRNA interferase HigB
MHLISQKALSNFWKKHPEAETPLRAWGLNVERLSWPDFHAVRAVYGSADQVGRCVVFNLGGNKFRLIAVIHYNTQRVYVRNVLTHAEYDRGHWKQECCGAQDTQKNKAERADKRKPERARKKR